MEERSYKVLAMKKDEEETRGGFVLFCLGVCFFFFFGRDVIYIIFFYEGKCGSLLITK